MDGTTLDHLYLLSSSYVGRSGFYEAFYLYPDSVTIARDIDSLGPKHVDCIVVPCANPQGFRTGVPSEIRPYVDTFLPRNLHTAVILADITFRTHRHTQFRVACDF